MRSRIGLAFATLAALAVTTGALAPSPAAAQQPAFPDRPIRMIFGFAPGGSGDMAARLLADVGTSVLGQRVVVENRTGANGMVAAEAIARSPADGHHVLFCTTGNMTIITELPGTRLPVDPATDLMALGQLLRSTFGLVVAQNSPWRTTGDVLAAARARPGQVTYASPGAGSVQHLSSELLSQTAGIRMIHVPYRGSQAAILDIIGGRTDFMITNLGDVISHIRQGTLRLIALGDPLGRRFFPEAPMIAEAVPGFETYAWFGLCGPRGVPAAAVRRWEEAIRAAVEDPEVSRKLLDNGMVPSFQDAAGLTRTMEENRRGYRAVIQAAGIRAE
jgi:tripartite-type tricarboxylate transporter receptor subunit TctC